MPRGNNRPRQIGHGWSSSWIGRASTASSWSFIAWAVLTRTPSVENALFGVVISVGLGIVLAGLGGRTVPPWSLLWPPRLFALLALLADTFARLVRANAKLAVLAWRFGHPPDTGVVKVPTALRSDGELAALGVLTSLIVDNQLVDLDRDRHLLWYHAIGLPDPDERYEAITASVERRILAVTRGRHG